MGKLDNKIAFITGAGSGMGKAQASLFAKEGATVIGADINIEGVKKVAEEIKTEGGDALAVEIDVSNKASVEAAVNKGLQQYGRVDILSNTAGILDG